MKAIGYEVAPPMLVQAADYGVPQTRARVIFIG
jgi:DNA (cytosine-5)-methyltransferase 1